MKRPRNQLGLRSILPELQSVIKSVMREYLEVKRADATGVKIFNKLEYNSQSS